MGDAQGQGGLVGPVFFLDENHCGNPHLHAAFEDSAVAFERLTDHFARGTPDADWIPIVAVRQWIVLTSDARIRSNFLERQAVRVNLLRLFYFSRNDIAGHELGQLLRKALPRILKLCQTQVAPFAASISKGGDVEVRDTFDED